MSAEWYSDQAAYQVHALIKTELNNMVAAVFPGHELSHIGINRNDFTEEVVIRLHLNPFGSVRVVPDPDPEQRKITR